MKKKILFPLFLLILLQSMHVFATGVTLNLLHGGLSLLDSLLLIAIGLVIIGVLLICIALFKPLPEPKEDAAKDIDADSDEDLDEDDFDDSEGFDEDDEDDDIEDNDDTDYDDEDDEDEDSEDDESGEDDRDDEDAPDDSEEPVSDEGVSDTDDTDDADNTPETGEEPGLPTEEENAEDSESPKEAETVQPEPTEEKIYPKLTLVDTRTHDFKILPLTGKTTIGRRRSNDLVLSDNTVSGQHCIILTDGEDIYIQDLDSTNGTFLNGKRIHEKTVLQRGDKLMLGKQEFTVNL